MVPSWTPTVLPARSSRLWMAWVEAEAASDAADAAELAVLEAVEELVLEQAVSTRAADIPAASRKLRREIFFIFIHSSCYPKA